MGSELRGSLLRTLDLRETLRNPALAEEPDFAHRCGYRRKAPARRTRNAQTEVVHLLRWPEDSSMALRSACEAIPPCGRSGPSRRSRGPSPQRVGRGLSV